MMDMGSIVVMFKEFGLTVIKGLMWAIPFVLLIVLLFLVFLYVRRAKIFRIDCIIDMVMDGNIVRCTDKGGIVRNLLGVEEFRFKKLKKCCAVPPQKYWLVQNTGKPGIHFYRHSADDFEPVDVSAGDAPKQRGLLDRLEGKYEKVNIKPSDIKDQLKKVNFTPVKSDSKQFLVMKNREITEKNKRKGKNDWVKPLVMYGSAIMLVVIIVIFWFNHADNLVNAQVDCTTPKEAADFAKQLCGYVEENPAPFETEGNKNPFTEVISG